MPVGKLNTAEMYCITRYKSKRNGKPLGWKVAMSRRGKMLNKAFPDQTWDGAENALAAAKHYRDALILRVPPITMREFAQTVRKNNTSGIVGVHSIQSRSGAVSWRAGIQLPGGKAISKTFSESIHGSRARELAIQTRQEMLNLVEETNSLTHNPGAIAEASPAEFPAAPRRLAFAPLLSVWSAPASTAGLRRRVYISGYRVR